MGNFTEGFWNLFIIVGTLGGIFALYLLCRFNTISAPDDGKVGDTGHVWDEDLRDLDNPLPRWWLNMFYLTLIFGVIYLIFYPGLGLNTMVLGWTQVKQYEQEMAAADARYGPLYRRYLETDIAAVAEDEEALKMGRRLFLNYCATCHGSDAGGGRGFPNLGDRDWLYGGQTEKIKESIVKGRNGMMPPWKEALGGDAAVKEVAQHVLALAGREHDAQAAAAGAERFKTFCVACHLADGTGNPAVGAPNLTDSIWLYGGSPGTIEESIAGGRQGLMPAHGEFLGEAKAHVLAAYVYSLSQKK